LVWFEGRNYAGEIFPADFPARRGIKLRVHLFASN
jgi:hypothetical protein